MEGFKLSNEVTVKTIALRMKKAESMIRFYKDMLGFILKSEENNLSIFGTKKRDSQILILEDVSYKVLEVTEEKKLAQFSLLIPTEDEFISVVRKLSSFNYPIKAATECGHEQRLRLEDPDGNEIEILHESIAYLCDEERNLDLKKLLTRSTVIHNVLSAEVRFSKLYLNVDNKSDSLSFYQQILGMTVDQLESNHLLIGNGNFSIYLRDFETNHSVEYLEDQLGVDFFISNINSKEDMLALKKHLEEKKMDFFIDNKMKILTIYDLSGIEWWFMRE